MFHLHLTRTDSVLLVLHTVVVSDGKACAQARKHVKKLHVNGGEGVHKARQIGSDQPHAIGYLHLDAHGSSCNNSAFGMTGEQ